MKCPKCKQILIVGKSRRYETSCEHCANPNKYYYEKPLLRETLYCKTKGCINNDKHIFWNQDGDVYINLTLWQKILIKFNCYNFKLKDPDDAIRIVNPTKKERR